MIYPGGGSSQALGWVLIESGSNQEFIFQSTRRRFNVGASAILKDLPSWVEQACSDLGGGFSPVVSTSSKALLLTDNADQGRQLVTAVTRAALQNCPGLDVWGYVEEPTVGNPMDRIAEVHARHAKARWSRPTPKQRFPLRPFLETCRLTGLPASGLAFEPGLGAGQPAQFRPVSAPAASILDRAEKATGDLRTKYGDAVLKDLDRDVLNAGWVAVVHADGNSVGQLIATIVSAEELGSFSTALAAATEDAFSEAVASIGHEQWLIPLIIGGDDVTFVCDGRVALEVTRAFLLAFEEKTRDAQQISAVAKKAVRRAHLTAGAGIAFVKPHFPFHAAYHLAEELADEAKVAKQDDHAPARSAYDFHVLHDSTARSLADIRQHLIDPDDGPIMWPGPFLAGARSDRESSDWEAQHEEAFLIEALSALQLDGDEQLLGGTGTHALREALLTGSAAAGRTSTGLIARSRDPEGLRSFLAAQVFSQGARQVNRLISVIDAADMAAGVAAGERGGRVKVEAGD